MYFLISRKIAVFITIITVNKTANLSTNSILKINIIIKDKKAKIGKIGCSPFIPEFNFIKFIKSIPKHSLCNKNPRSPLSR